MSKFQTKKILSAVNVATEQTSETIDMKFNYGFAVQCSFTGAPSGSVLVEGSNDEVSWSTIDTLTISGTDVLASNKDAIYWPSIRVKKAAGGTGTMTATITIKGA